MTVKELIEQLQKCPPWQDVQVSQLWETGFRYFTVSDVEVTPTAVVIGTDLEAED